MFINRGWCNPEHITVKDQLCSRDVEVLAVSVHPFYLPWDFSHIPLLRTELSIKKVLDLWKTCCLFPVPKIIHRKEPNHSRPVALTSNLIK